MSSIDQLLQQGVDKKLFPGCALSIIGPDEATFFSAGRQTYDHNAPTISEHTFYDVASITKSIPTSSLVLHLIEVGKINVDDQLDQYLPMVKAKPLGSLKIRQLLSFAPQFPFTLSELKNSSATEILNTVINSNWSMPAAKDFPVSNATAILLTLLLIIVGGQSIDNQAAEIFFQPLEMNRTTFHLESIPFTSIAPTEVQEWRGGLIQGQTHDESAWKLRSIMVVGSAGLFSCTADLAKFGQMLLNHGSYKNHQYFKPETIEQMHTNQLADDGLVGGLGWEIQKSWMGTKVSSSAFGKTGFTGCFMLIDPVQEKGLVFLSNCVYPHRPVDRTHFNNFRIQLCDLIMT